MQTSTELAGTRITYLGDWVFYTGPTFIESPFEMMAKDCHLQFLGKPVTEALRAASAQVSARSNWDLYHMELAEYQDLLSQSDVLIISDVEARCFHLNPSFFDRSVYGKEVITFPDRLRLLKEAVEEGLGIVYLGGWLSFSGYMEKGGWRRSPIASWLPFSCLPGDDLCESSEGFLVDEVAEHEMTRGLPLSTLPPLLGYNEFVARPSMQVLWRIRGTEHPLLGISEHGKGRFVTYASDPVPHWGINLMLWEAYAEFFVRLCSYARRRR